MSKTGQTKLISAFDLFVLGISLLSLLNIVLSVLPIASSTKQVIAVVDIGISILLLGDFCRRFYAAPNRRTYFFRDRGWLDLIGSVPFPVLRLARLFRVSRDIRSARREGGRTLVRKLLRERSSSTLLTAFFFTIVLLEFGAIYVLRAESQSQNANIKTASDSLWWGYVSITTVGYGDRYPVTTGGRILGALVLTIGVGVFSIVTGFFATLFNTAPDQGEDGPATHAEIAALRAELSDYHSEVLELKQVIAASIANHPPTPEG